MDMTIFGKGQNVKPDLKSVLACSAIMCTKLRKVFYIKKVDYILCQ